MSRRVSFARYAFAVRSVQTGTAFYRGPAGHRHEDRVHHLKHSGLAARWEQREYELADTDFEELADFDPAEFEVEETVSEHKENGPEVNHPSMSKVRMDPCYRRVGRRKCKWNLGRKPRSSTKALVRSLRRSDDLVARLAAGEAMNGPAERRRMLRQMEEAWREPAPRIPDAVWDRWTDREAA
ncbi:MAG: hypothetical protein ACOYUZ_03450 [Patescibacteria group bacterium]